MNIIITIQNKNIKIALKKGKKVVNEISLPDNRDLGEKLLPVVDKMFKKANIESKNVEKVEVFSNQNDSFTTTRIAKTFAKTFNWAKARNT
jgi:tRNA A37 threonylcarbamoyladenosine modification protein TsaB